MVLNDLAFGSLNDLALQIYDVFLNKQIISSFFCTVGPYIVIFAIK